MPGLNHRAARADHRPSAGIVLSDNLIQLALMAAVFHIVNHATFKASLFMAAGIVDHETGTRDIPRLSGLRHAGVGCGHRSVAAERGSLARRIRIRQRTGVRAVVTGRGGLCRRC